MQRQSLRLIELITCVISSKPLPFIVHVASHVQPMHEIPDFKAPETATEGTSPFCVRTKKNHLRIRVHVNVEMYEFRTEASRTDAEHVFTVKPSVARITTEFAGRIQIRYSTSNTQTQDVRLPDTKAEGNYAPNFQV